jgi:hypothetical protein
MRAFSPLSIVAKLKRRPRVMASRNVKRKTALLAAPLGTLPVIAPV